MGMEPPAFEEVPVIDVHMESASQVWVALEKAIKTATFLALDCELSGLGPRRQINAHNIEERYCNVCDVARSRGVVALGVSTFRFLNVALEPREWRGKMRDGTQWQYVVQNFNISTLRRDAYVVDPESMKFLVMHGFDFTKQYLNGIQYWSGNDRLNKEEVPFCLRRLFALIMASKVPVLVHNGFIDLIFLYQHFYAELPKTMETFLADLVEMFPAGVFDTKYIAEYISPRMDASFLEYIFRKSQQLNEEFRSRGSKHLGLLFPHLVSPLHWVEVQACKPILTPGDGRKVCQDYANFGYCRKKDCSDAHDIESLLQWDIRRMQGKRKLNQCVDMEEAIEPEDEGESDPVALIEMPCSGHSPIVFTPGNKCHRAGFDAFMTAFSFAWFVTRRSDNPLKPQNEEAINRIYLSCKDFPLQVRKIGNANVSANHSAKRLRLENP